MKLKSLLASLLICGVSASFATESCLGGNTKVSSSQVEKILAPVIGNAKVVNVSDSPISGVYEVIVDFGGKKVPVYVDCNLKYLISGEIIDLNKKVSLTREKVQALQSQANSEKEAKLAKLIGKDKAEMLKKEGLIEYINFVNVSNLPQSNITYGSGKTKVYVVTDPQCPFCAKLHKEIEKVISERKDVVFEMLLYPLPFHKEAQGISENIACQKENNQKQQLLNKSFDAITKGDQNLLKSLEKSCETAKSIISNNINFAKSAGINGTPTMIFPKGVMVSGAIPAETLNKLIDTLR
ncbi:MAG: DsbC family protein [Hydrogenothermaceae bacterium]|nr:DsbC family protein [Hydrogenothermaceae bacterium]